MTIGVKLTYKEEAQAAYAQTSTTVTDVVVQGEKTTPLPDNTEKDSDYDVIYTFRNLNAHLPATNVSTTVPYVPGFTLKDNTCGKTLAPNESCQITGKYKAGTVGPKALQARFNYKEEPLAVVLKNKTRVTDVVVSSAITDSLDANTALNSRYPVKITFTNTNNILPANNITLIKSFPSSFTEDKNTCGDTLQPKQNCYISGTFHPTTIGTHNIGLTFRYAQGADIVKTLSSYTDRVTITARRTQTLPGSVYAQSGSYEFSFTFTNNSQRTPASQIRINRSAPSGSISYTKDDCRPTLTPGATCTISGKYTPKLLGRNTLDLMLNYAEGVAVRAGDYVNWTFNK